MLNANKICIYITFTFVLYIAGFTRWEYNINFEIYLYIFLCIIAIQLGWLFAKRNHQLIIRPNSIKNFYIHTFLLCAYPIFYIYAYMGNSNLNLIDLVINGFVNSKLNYDASFLKDGRESLLIWLLVLFSIYYYYYLVKFIRRYNYFTKKEKLIVFIILILAVLKHILMGRNKGVFDIICLFFFFLCISDKKINLKSLFYIVMFLLLFFVYFINNIASRSQWLLNIDDYSLFNFLMLENNINLIIEYVSNYLSQGYHALNLSFQSNASVNIFNFSSVLQEKIKSFSGYDIFKDTYHYNLNVYGWDPKVRWHTGFLALINAFGYVGSVFVLMILSYLTSYLLYFARLGCDISGVLLFFMLITWFYMPGNLQVFNYSHMTYPFIFFIFLFILRKIIVKKFNYY